MNLTLLVLAAGMGSRYGGLKQIDPVGPSGEFILDYSVYDALQAGFSKVVFVIRREMEPIFREALGRRVEDRLEVAYAFQEPDSVPSWFAVPPEREKPWGTGHATLVAREVVHEPFVVINADDFYGREAYQMLADYLRGRPDPKANDYAIAGFRLKQTVSPHGSVSRGVCQVDQQGWLASIVERTKIEGSEEDGFHFDDAGETGQLSGDEIVSMNIWGFTTPVFAHLDRLFQRFLDERGQEEGSEFFLPDAIDRLITSDHARVKVLETPDRWLGVTYPPDKERVEKGIRQLVDAGIYPKNLWAQG